MTILPLNNNESALSTRQKINANFENIKTIIEPMQVKLSNLTTVYEYNIDTTWVGDSKEFNAPLVKAGSWIFVQPKPYSDISTQTYINDYTNLCLIDGGQREGAFTLTKTGAINAVDIPIFVWIFQP